MEASVSFLLENLKQLLVNHAKLVSGAEGELKALQDDLALMKGKLVDASNKQYKDEAFKAWEKQIRKVVYQVEDTIDSCITEAAAKSTVQRAFSTGRLAKEVKLLREGAVKEVFDLGKTQFANLGTSDPIDHESDDKRTELWRSKESKKTKIVGLVEETSNLIEYLKKESDGLEVIPITGMPGLGKTTFAWKIFQDPDILFDFPVRIWVTVSQQFNRKDVFLNILKCFTQQIDGFIKMSDDELAPLVKERLDKGKFLMVLDDMWTADAWIQIKSALPMYNSVGRVLITTRSSKVSSHANTSKGLPKELRFLNPEESWELLQYEVYDELNSIEDKALVNVGKLIAKDCDGLPLSIVVIAGILRDMIATSRESNALILQEWEKVSVSVKDYLINKDQEQRMSKIIALSYSKLPYGLRHCFLYMGMFPEDAEIPAWELTLLWIAEGFIQPDTGFSFEEIALANLNDLISRNLVRVVNTKLNGEVKTCSVHDAIRAFCQDEAGSEKENLFQEIRLNEEHGVFAPTLENIEQYRRLSIHSYIHKFFSQKLVAIPTRSFLCFPKDPINLETTDLASVNKAFSLLRVFGAEKIKFPKFPSKFPQLIHLRYLTLSVTFDLWMLPDAIVNIWNLQTLLVETRSRTLEIKADLWKLMQLRHFKTKSSIILTASKNGKGQGGENLQTLSRLSPQSCTDSNVLSKAKNLHTLGIHGDLSKLFLQPKCLENLNCLNNLKLEHDVHPLLTKENKLRSLIPHTNFPMKLAVLTLKGTYLGWEEMKTIGKLGKLRVLKLKDHAFMGKSWDVVDNGFHKLEVLYIERIDLVLWTASARSFPTLRCLAIKNCEDLGEIPSALGETLEKLSLERVTPAAVSSAKKIEKDKLNDGKTGGFELVIGAGDKKSKS